MVKRFFRTKQQQTKETFYYTFICTYKTYMSLLSVLPMNRLTTVIPLTPLTFDIPPHHSCSAQRVETQSVVYQITDRTLFVGHGQTSRPPENVYFSNSPPRTQVRTSYLFIHPPTVYSPLFLVKDPTSPPLTLV